MSKAFEYQQLPSPRSPRSPRASISSNKSGSIGQKLRSTLNRGRDGSGPKSKMSPGQMAKLCDEFMHAVSTFRQACPGEAGLVEEKIGAVLESVTGFKTSLDNLERFRTVSHTATQPHTPEPTRRLDLIVRVPKSRCGPFSYVHGRGVLTCRWRGPAPCSRARSRTRPLAHPPARTPARPHARPPARPLARPPARTPASLV